ESVYAARATTAREQAKLDSNREKKSELCLLVGQCLQVDGRIREAVKWLEECCWLRSWLDEEDSSRLASQHELARAYEADGRVKRAVELKEHVVAVKVRVLRDDHPSRLVSIEVLEDMSQVCTANGQFGLDIVERIFAESKLASEQKQCKFIINFST